MSSTMNLAQAITVLRMWLEMQPTTEEKWPYPREAMRVAVEAAERVLELQRERDEARAQVQESRAAFVDVAAELERVKAERDESVAALKYQQSAIQTYADDFNAERARAEKLRAWIERTHGKPDFENCDCGSCQVLAETLAATEVEP